MQLFYFGSHYGEILAQLIEYLGDDIKIPEYTKLLPELNRLRVEAEKKGEDFWLDSVSELGVKPEDLPFDGKKFLDQLFQPYHGDAIVAFREAMSLDSCNGLKTIEDFARWISCVNTGGVEIEDYDEQEKFYDRHSDLVDNTVKLVHDRDPNLYLRLMGERLDREEIENKTGCYKRTAFAVYNNYVNFNVIQNFDLQEFLNAFLPKKNESKAVS